VLIQTARNVVCDPMYNVVQCLLVRMYIHQSWLRIPPEKIRDVSLRST
jgi:hypothetical protein